MANFTQPKLYLAGPLGFTAAGREYHHLVVIPHVCAAGFEPLDPWALADDIELLYRLPPSVRTIEELAAANERVGRRNAELIGDADAVFAILDGTDVDSGTAAEIGYAAALRKPVVGLRTDLRRTGDNEATTVNLQVEWFIRASGGAVVSGDIGDAIQKLSELIA